MGNNVIRHSLHPTAKVAKHLELKQAQKISLPVLHAFFPFEDGVGHGHLGYFAASLNPVFLYCQSTTVRNTISYKYNQSASNAINWDWYVHPNGYPIMPIFYWKLTCSSEYSSGCLHTAGLFVFRLMMQMTRT